MGCKEILWDMISRRGSNWLSTGKPFGFLNQHKQVKLRCVIEPNRRPFRGSSVRPRDTAV